MIHQMTRLIAVRGDRRIVTPSVNFVGRGIGTLRLRGSNMVSIVAAA